ncbi:hypothetical protein OAL44_02760 [Planctomycetaceae bacterium]|nr:hypothetical protein [Planctomycetaceae bacterium]
MSKANTLQRLLWGFLDKDDDQGLSSVIVMGVTFRPSRHTS